ncbi:hypothetical protein AB1Y20_013740 [Prymnesium parvum]|uniref:SET domain-containing protein n=1 Tax=Prymnesium parvum TaxID=97485 RepID=A0AB34IIN9_PRYPA
MGWAGTTLRAATPASYKDAVEVFIGHVGERATRDEANEPNNLALWRSLRIPYASPSSMVVRAADMAKRARILKAAKPTHQHHVIVVELRDAKEAVLLERATREHADLALEHAEHERQRALADLANVTSLAEKAEAARQQAESARVQAESARMQAESARMQAESARMQAEAARMQAEAAWAPAAESAADPSSSLAAPTIPAPVSPPNTHDEAHTPGGDGGVVVKKSKLHTLDVEGDCIPGRGLYAGRRFGKNSIITMFSGQLVQLDVNGIYHPLSSKAAMAGVACMAKHTCNNVRINCKIDWLRCQEQEHHKLWPALPILRAVKDIREGEEILYNYRTSTPFHI